MKKNNFSPFIWISLLTSIQCTIAYIALMTGLSYVFSNSLLIFSLFTGLYLLSMGLGTLFVEQFTFDSKRLIQLMIINSLLSVVLANPGVIGTLFVNEYFHLILRNFSSDILFLPFPLALVLTSLIGLVSGASLPLFLKIFEKENRQESKPIINLLVSDYFGAFLGIIIFSLLLNPFFGLIKSIIYAQTATIIFINRAVFKTGILKETKNLRIGFCTVNLLVFTSLLFQNRLVDLLNNISSF